MLQYISIKGGAEPVDFETAILDGFAADGGLYVPQSLPQVSLAQLKQWKNLSYVELAFEVLSLFIDRSSVSELELKTILQDAYAPFEKQEIIPLHPLKSRSDTFIMELFHGPTISFKDIGLAFLVNLVNFFLARKNQRLSLIVATTGETGPATAYFCAGKSQLDAWVLYPKELITKEQERQMTCLAHPNIHPFAVSNCPRGGDDLDALISKLYADNDFKSQLKLSSVNSINWGRVMMQTVHYFYGYLQVVDTLGEKINVSVPSGGFGNLCAGALAREMGLPIKTLVAANNKNACLDRIFSRGLFSKQALQSTPSSAIDILIPINFWRYLYFKIGADSTLIKTWMDEFETTGSIQFESHIFEKYSAGFLSYSATDEQTLALIKSIYETEQYLLDPHAAVSLAAADTLKEQLGNEKLICLATAHPAKFPKVIQQALADDVLPDQAMHDSIEQAKKLSEKLHLCEYDVVESALRQAMLSNWQFTHGSDKTDQEKSS
ncbi:MAG: threonine synthase [Oceanospirillaceae bacterium]|nr:threonine synthase [Oceanospirillaceae bacterium]